MSDYGIAAIGGLLCGIAAGAAAQYGRLCTFAAVEDALIAHDLRRARAFSLALAVALLGTQALTVVGLIDPSRSIYGAGRIEVLALALGSMLFGVGMALVGTCGFGLLVRAGSGDLRAALMAMLLGLAAFAATGGPLAPVRLALGDVGAVTLGPAGSGSLAALPGSGTAHVALAIGLAAALAVFALISAKVRGRPRLLIAALLLGAAVTGGWLTTGALADPFANTRLESLTFVAPIGRVLLVVMGESLASAGFAVASVLGVVAGSCAVAAGRRELRWEAFDDYREMRRHMLGAVLMGIGGVLARGCTIGQGLSAFSLLAVTAPIAVAGMVLGARLGLAYLIDQPAPGRVRRPWAK